MRGVLAVLIVLLTCGVGAADGGDPPDVVRGTERAVPPRGVPRLKAQPVFVGPAVDVALIQRVVRQKHGELRRCYQSGLHRVPNLRGRITVEVVIDPSGAVTRASETTSTTMPDPAVVRCVLRSFGALVFPRLSAAALLVDYPLEFVP